MSLRLKHPNGTNGKLTINGPSAAKGQPVLELVVIDHRTGGSAIAPFGPTEVSGGWQVDQSLEDADHHWLFDKAREAGFGIVEP